MPRLLLCAVAAAVGPAAHAQTWQFQGPAPVTGGQTSTTPGTVAGATQSILADPTDSNRLFIGTTNGGVWRTTTGGTSWTPLTDQLGATSIGALKFDPTDAARNALALGFGRWQNSSYGYLGGNRLGVAVSLDGGTTWVTKPINAANAPDVNGLAARSLGVGTGTLVTSSLVNGASGDVLDYSYTGIWRSTTGGNTWTHVSGGAGTGLPLMATYGLFETAGDNSRLFTATYATTGTPGLYRSTDTGASWSQAAAGNSTLNTAIANASNVRMSASSSAAFLGVINSAGQLDSLWRSADGGTTWTAFGGALTQTNPGGQGNLHFNLQVDPTNSSRVYVTGDRESAGPYNGQVYRVDFSAGTFTKLTNNGVNAPHADGRSLAVRADGALLAGSDGGLAAMPNAATAAANGNPWAAVNGNLGTLEVHSLAYDPVSKVIFGGMQDNGTAAQSAPGGTSWAASLGGDGGQVAVVASPTSSTQSLRYQSYQYFGRNDGNLNANTGFFRLTYTAAGALTGGYVNPALTVSGSGGQTLFRYENAQGDGVQFYGPVATNRADGNRLLLGTRRVYESLDQGATLGVLKDFGANTSVTVIRADGFTGTTPQPNALWVATSGTANQVWVRPAAGGPLAQTAYAGGGVTGLSVQPTNWQHVAVSDSAKVYRTTNAGAAFSDITGNLLAANPGANSLFSVAAMNFSNANGSRDVYLAGGRDGVYSSTSDALGTWTKFGAGLPNTLVTDIEYNPTDDLLLVAAFGRGTWTVPAFSTFFAPVPEPTTALLVAAPVLAAGAVARRRRAAA